MNDWNPESVLKDYYEQCFSAAKRPALHYGYQFEKAIKWLHRALRRPPRLKDLRPQTVGSFALSLRDMGLNKDTAENHLARIKTLWRFAAEQGHAAPYISVARSRFGPDPLPLPRGDPGTLLALFWDRYMPEHLAQTKSGVDHYWSFFRHLRACFGRDLRPEELSSPLLAEFTAYLMKQAGRGGRAMSASRIRGHRVAFVTFWRFAASIQLAPPLPPIRHPKVPRQQPDSWTLEEFGRIVAASRRLTGKRSVGGVDAEKVWPALLLVAYYTGLRRAALLRLRPSDVNLDTGWLYVPGEFMKNACGQSFRIGADAIAALRDIMRPERDRLFAFSLKHDRHLDTHFDEILAMAKVEKGSRISLNHFHKIRRTAVSQTAANAGLAEAIALAGHSREDVTRRYIDPTMLPKTDATKWLQAPPEAPPPT